MGKKKCTLWGPTLGAYTCLAFLYPTFGKREQSIPTSAPESRVDTLGVYTLGVYTLGVYSLGLPILDLEPHTLGVYTLGVYTLGVARATDFGSGSPFTYS